MRAHYPLQSLIGSGEEITSAAKAVAARFDLGRVRHVAPLSGAGRRNALIETESDAWVLRVGTDPANLGNSSRGLATGLDVLRRERYFAAAIRDRAQLPSPWPYEIDAACDLLPRPYAVMPRLPGTTLWWSEDQDWEAVGVALAETALALHRPAWPAAGNWDPATNDITPFDQNAGSRCRARIADLIERIAITSEPLDDESRTWVADQATITDSAPADHASLIHGDLVIGNVCMVRSDRTWSVTGVFDLENARIGDPEEDLVGHLWWACYGGRPEAAASFVRRYNQERPISPRILVYLIASMLDNWEFGRRNQEPWYGGARTFGEWARPLYAAAAQALTHLS
ncbi:MAG TPA: aminoglycoside phosphotransferase family protein [Mycobacteriales bacterium]|jgi:aminoglycoside phosphotransferase (APT) family kinase protein|nr:aminoglycoside phosphotransferase family protein [Mycobacteriales bacterium]